MAAFLSVVRSGSPGNHPDFANTAMALSCGCAPAGVRLRLIAIWTIGAGGRLDCHWDVAVPPHPPG
jgi:hypothetical protein